LDGLRRNTSIAYVVAVLWAVPALLVRLVMNAVIGTRGSYLFFLLATLCSAAVGGFRFGLVTILSGILLAGFTRPPLGSFQLIDPSDPAAILRFLFSALVVSNVCEMLIADRERARTAERRLEES
jgi:K+-sensing histidine kinase KdpD